MTAEIKIASSPQLENLGNQKAKYDNIYKTDNFDKQNLWNYLPVRNILKRDTKKKLYLKYEDVMKCRPFILTKQEYEATHNNSDLKVVTPNFRCKRDNLINQIDNGNHTFNLSKQHIEANNSYKGVLNLIHRDLDSFYDNELIRKVSDINGNLPVSLKVVIHEDKDPVVVADESLKNNKFEKRKIKTTKSNVYYDNNYDDQLSDNSQLNSGEYVRKKFVTTGAIINRPIKSSNSSVSDNNKGNLPVSLKLVIHEDKNPIVVADESLKNSKLEKRKIKSTKSNVYYDYNYDDQLSDNSQLNSGEYDVRKKFSTTGAIINRPVKSSNSSVSNNNKGVSNTITVSVLTAPKITAPIIVNQENKSIKPHVRDKIEMRGEEKSNRSSNVKDISIKLKNSLSDNQIKAVPKRKDSCMDTPGEQGCHPGGGLPKNPGMPPFNKKSKDVAYDKLIKGDTSEKVVKAIIERVQKNSRMASELGICDFDIAELRNLFKQMRSKDKKECCFKLKGEFKCFLNWLLTIEPSRKKRSNYSQEKVSGFTSCNKFPKFSVLSGGDYCKPSPQYEKLEQKVEEYREESNNL